MGFLNKWIILFLFFLKVVVIDFPLLLNFLKRENNLRDSVYFHFFKN